MKYIIIGDTHGKIEIVKHFLSSKYEGIHKIFIGDYVDSFDRSTEDQIKIVKKLLKAVRKREDVTCLIGNHELSYIRSGMQCSGYSGKTNHYMRLLKQDIFQNFKRHFYITDDILVTHAGATGLLFKDKEDVREKLENDDKSLYNIGYARGGLNKYGGIFWCDYWMELQNIEGLVQIVGHSSHRPKGEDKGIVFRDDCYNIDCLDRVNQALSVIVDDEVSIEAIEFKV